MGKHSVAIQKVKVLEAYAEVGTITHACKKIGLPRRTFHLWMKKDKAFLAAYEQAQEEVVESLESEAMRRAVQGNEEPVYQMGQKVGTIRKYSDVLLIFLLKGHKPEKYRDSHDAGYGKTPHADREEVLNEIHSKLARLAPAISSPEAPEKPER